MPTYVLLSTLTSEGGATLHANPDRLTAVNDEIIAMGCKVVGQYALLGQYDFLTIIDAPDNETVAHLSVDLSSRGTTKITTLPAISVMRLVEKLKGPAQIGRTTRKTASKATSGRAAAKPASRRSKKADSVEDLARFVD